MRKTKIVTITAEGRDKGKSYLITEMPAMQAEKWAAKALLALSRSGVEIEDETLQMGAAAVLAAGLTAFRRMNFADAEPLLDEMMSCVAFVPDRTRIDPVANAPLTRPLFPDDIEEVATLLTLRGEVVEIHTGFSVAAALSNAAAAALRRSSPAQMSRTRSRSSSGKAKRRSPSAKASTD